MINFGLFLALFAECFSLFELKSHHRVVVQDKLQLKQQRHINQHENFLLSSTN